VSNFWPNYVIDTGKPSKVPKRQNIFGVILQKLGVIFLKLPVTLLRTYLLVINTATLVMPIAK